MDCSEVNEGYKVRYTPLVTGDYYITVKYNAYHITGSPFRVKCQPSSALQDQHSSAGHEPRLVTTLTQTQSMRQVQNQQQQVSQQTQTTTRREAGSRQQEMYDQRSQPNYPIPAEVNANASKVTVSGVGLTKAFVGKSNSFTVNCSNAGMNLNLLQINCVS
jgi:filamin